MSRAPTTPGEAVEALEAFLGDVVDPLEAEHRELLTDPTRRFDSRGITAAPILDLRRRVRRAAAARGLFGLFVPATLGGSGAGAACQLAVYLHLYTRSGPDRPLPYESVATFTSGPGAALVGLSDQVRAGVWRSVMSGEEAICFAMSEPTAPPAGAALATTAKRTPSGWAISGSKQWVSGGGYAAWAVVYASTLDDAPAGTEGVTAFLVRLDAPGVEIGGPTRILGRTGGEEVTVQFTEVEVTEDRVVGELHHGRDLAHAGGAGRAMHAAGRSVGLGRWALGTAISSARAAVVFGRVLAEDALVQAELAETACELLVARHAAEAVAGAIDAGRGDPLETQMMTSFCAEAWGRAYDRTMRLVGGDALRSDARFFDGWDQSMIVRAAEGTSGPMRIAIGKELLRRG